MFTIFFIKFVENFDWWPWLEQSNNKVMPNDYCYNDYCYEELRKNHVLMLQVTCVEGAELGSKMDLASH